MSYIGTQKADLTPNFLASAVGLITKSYTVSAESVEADEYGRKIVMAGTIYPANDATAAGILFDNVDVTEGNHAGSVIIAGRIFKDCLPKLPSESALPVLNASGIIFTQSDETTRG